MGEGAAELFTGDAVDEPVKLMSASTVSDEEQNATSDWIERGPSRELEDKDSLDHQLSPVEWENLESEFRFSNTMLTFTIDAPLALVADRMYCGFTEFIPGIKQVCASGRSASM